MLEKPQINHPANFVTSTAVGFADPNGNLSLVSGNTPLPVIQGRPAPPPALSGETRQSILAGPFAPLRDSPIHLSLTGIWTGNVTLLRSADGGLTRLPLTVGGQPWARFTGNANEVVWQEAEAGATFYLDIVLASGTLTYRVAQ